MNVEIQRFERTTGTEHNLTYLIVKTLWKDHQQIDSTVSLHEGDTVESIRKLFSTFLN